MPGGRPVRPRPRASGSALPPSPGPFPARVEGASCAGPGEGDRPEAPPPTAPPPPAERPAALPSSPRAPLPPAAGGRGPVPCRACRCSPRPRRGEARPAPAPGPPPGRSAVAPGRPQDPPGPPRGRAEPPPVLRIRSPPRPAGARAAEPTRRAAGGVTGLTPHRGGIIRRPWILFLFVTNLWGLTERRHVDLCRVASQACR
ncbi:putative leader peptide [Nocardiopsis composta]